MTKKSLDKKVLVGITGCNNSHWKEKIKEIKKFKITKVALFLERFNNEYGGSLNEHQKNLLNKYITSYKDDGLELKMFLYNEIDRLRENLKKQIGGKNDNSSNLELVLKKMEEYSTKKIDRKMITEVIKIQSLVGEINNGD